MLNKHKTPFGQLNSDIIFILEILIQNYYPSAQTIVLKYWYYS